MRDMRNLDFIFAAAPWRALALALPLLAAGCGLLPDKPLIPQPIAKPAREQKPAETAAAAAPTAPAFYRTPQPPDAARTDARRAPAAAPAEGVPVNATIDLQNQPLPQFIETVFVHILKRNVSLDPQVQTRNDMVSLRTGKPQTEEQLFEAARGVLRSYGVAINEFSGMVRFVPDKAESGYLPEIRRGRALPEVPAALRPVFYLAELEHTNAAQTVNWLRTLFPGGRLTAQEDVPRNAILLGGQNDTVNAALEVIQILDQPAMRGRVSARIVPVYWSADEMGKRLTEILQAEGYAVAQQPGASTPLLVLAVPPVNSVIVFASNEQTLNHALRWVRELDQPTHTRGMAGNFITYYVRNTDAADLAKTLSEVMGAAPAAPAAGAAGAAGGAGGGGGGVTRGGGKVVVSAARNALIIQASRAEYQQWHGLLQELDRPARSALVMATVAEVRLTDTEQLGFQWIVSEFMRSGYRVNMGTFAPGTPPSAAAGSFRIAVASILGDPRGLLTALASTNKIRILSNPSVMARNGEQAIIQVGQEVPILTSQISNANTGTIVGSSGILQTIQYRNTGVILKVKPVIHAGGRIDLDVIQEVSAAQANETGVNSSPIILTRKVDTKLSVSDGGTVLLGGLMQEQRTKGNSGIPFLKDIPLVGPIFSTGMSDNSERTELVVLLTPFVIEDDFDARAITDTFRNQFQWARALPAPLDRGTPAPEAVSPVSSPESPSGGPPPAVPQAAVPPQPSRAVVSQPYVLPEKDPKQQSVAPAQHSPAAAVPSGAAALPKTPSNGVDSAQEKAKLPAAAAPGATSAPEPQGKAVTDEKLKQELLEAVRGGNPRPPAR
jgi:general secretion pathway protein D